MTCDVLPVTFLPFWYKLMIWTICEGAVSALDSEHACSSSLLTTPATDVSSGEGQLLILFLA